MTYTTLGFVFIFLIKTSESTISNSEIINIKRKMFDRTYDQKNKRKKNQFSLSKNHLQVDFENIHEAISLDHSDDSLNLSNETQSNFFSTAKKDFIYPVDPEEPIDLSFKRQNQLNSTNLQYLVSKTKNAKMSNVDKDNLIQLNFSNISNHMDYNKTADSPQAIFVRTKECCLTMPLQYQMLKIDMRNDKFEDISHQTNSFIQISENTYIISTDKNTPHYHSLVNNSTNQFTTQKTQFIEILDSNQPQNVNDIKNEYTQEIQMNAQKNLNENTNKVRISGTTKKHREINNNKKLIFETNLLFIKKISSLFTFQKIFSISNDLSALCTNLETFLSNEIYVSNFALIGNAKETNQKFAYQSLDDTLELKYLCPFCSFQTLNADNFKNTNKKFIDNFIFMKTGSKPINIFIKYFEEISDLFCTSFTLDKLFSSQFFESQSIILKKVYDILDSSRILFKYNKKIDSIHVEYHKFFLMNIGIKLHFLPEIESIIYVFLSTPFKNHTIIQNKHLVMLFLLPICIKRVF